MPRPARTRPKADRPTPSPKAPGAGALGERLRDYALAELARAQAQLARQGVSRHAGVHQARKSMRRVRATLALARGPLGERGRRLDRGLSSLCGGLGSLRDAQALTEALPRLEGAGAQGFLPEAMALATARRDAMLARSLGRDPDLARRRKRLAAMAASLAQLDWGAVDHQDVLACVALSERRLVKARRRASRRPDDDERWHVLRRRLRRLRQQDSVLLDVEPTLRPREDASPAEATALGHAQDDALLLRHCGRGSPFPPAMRRAIREIAQDRLDRMRAVAGKRN